MAGRLADVVHSTRALTHRGDYARHMCRSNLPINVIGAVRPRASLHDGAVIATSVAALAAS